MEAAAAASKAAAGVERVERKVDESRTLLHQQGDEVLEAIASARANQ